MLLFLAHERRLVAAVYRLIPEPRGQDFGGSKFWLRANMVEAGGAQVRRNREGASVVEAELYPRLAAGEAIPAERFLESTPHEHCRVVGPSVTRPGQRAYYLDRLHALFAEPLAVQSPRRALEVGVRKG